MTNLIDSVRQFYGDAHRVYEDSVRPRLDAVGEAAGQAVHDAGSSGIDALTSDPLGFAADAVTLPYEAASALAGAAITVANGVANEGVVDVASDVLQHNAAELSRIRTEAHERPEQLVEWLLGPDGPKLQDQTALVPGLQDAFGDLIDAGMGNRWIAGPIGQALGFEYVPVQAGDLSAQRGDFYTTSENSLQSYLGFHDVYDSVGRFLGMDLDDRVMEFGANGVEYRLELWRGSYAAGGAFGGEIALYTRGAGDRGELGNQLEQANGGYYSAASGDNQIAMTQTIYDTKTGEEYFTNSGAGADGSDSRHFWNLGIRTDPAVDHENLGQRGELEVSADMPVSERDELVQAIRTGLESQEGVDNVRVSDDGRTVSYDWR